MERKWASTRVLLIVDLEEGFFIEEEEAKARRIGRREMGGGSYRGRGDDHGDKSRR